MDYGIKDNVCLVDSATTNTILKNQKFFSELMFIPQKVSTIVEPMQKIEGSKRGHMMLPNGTHLFIKDALFSKSSRKNLIVSKTSEWMGYHIETVSEGNKEYLCIVTSIGSKKHILEKLSTLSSVLHDNLQCWITFGYEQNNKVKPEA